MVFIQREFKMGVYLKHYGIAVTKYVARDTGISGSSRFNNVVSWFEDTLIPRSSKDLLNNSAKTAVVSTDGRDTSGEARVSAGKRLYKVNRKRLLDRLNAYVCLSRSRKFLAFYSVSFPSGTADEVVSKIWNASLTSLREKLGLKSYIWVMERQSNGTMHYHMLTNDYMPVRAVNTVVADCIDYYVKKGVTSWGNSSVTRYNGVDVENISKRVRSQNPAYASNAYRMVVKYVTKYMSKNRAEESRRQWHCSRVVSALFVTAYLSVDEANILFEDDADILRNRKVVQTEFAELILFAATDSSTWRSTIGIWNDRVYEYFERENLW